MENFKSLDFSTQQNIDLNYASETSVPPDKSDMFLACAISYNFDLPYVMRYTGGNYIVSHQNVEDIVGTFESVDCS